MDRKNTIIITIIAFAVILIAVIFLIVDPFSEEPAMDVENRTFRTPTPPPVTESIDSQQVKTKTPEEEPAQKTGQMPGGMHNKTDTYIVKEGETLQSIAEKIYGDKTKWFKIFTANESNIDWYDTIYVGQKLKIPSLASK